MPERPTFHRVIVAVDGSRHSDLALAVAIALAERDNARLAILTVIPNVSDSTAALAYGVPVDPIAMQFEADSGAERTMRKAIDAVPDEQPLDSVTRRGHAGPEIVAQVKEGRHDAVVLGARGLGRIGALFGSVSQYVLHHAGVAVFVAHAPED
ncbi:MAG TPA: universal stress protein [Baekduia sp.]|uniref:universal stress protein n=1 Tax=Baekduia sp. TaxID=2600305 RepID=UPI002B52CF30|nr:universal stress protein [Baekduia sp.]HMJ37648.1 universal stress protein [Baekduia sp.]